MSKLVNLTGLTRFWTKAKDYIDTALNGKADKVSGKGLSTNDLTATLKGNYDAAYTHSNNNAAHVTAAQKTAWDAKADGDHNHNGTYALASHSHAYSDLTGRPTIPTKVSQLTDAADYVKKTDITGVYKYKGSVANVGALPTTNVAEGDVYNVEADGGNYAWTGEAWDALGGTVAIETATNAEIDAIFA